MCVEGEWHVSKTHRDVALPSRGSQEMPGPEREVWGEIKFRVQERRRDQVVTPWSSDTTRLACRLNGVRSVAVTLIRQCCSR